MRELMVISSLLFAETGGLPYALLGDILCLSRVNRHPVTTNKPTT
jgi:hypothetical protein